MTALRGLLLVWALALLPAAADARTLTRCSPGGGRARGPAVLMVPDFGYGREIYDFHGDGLAPTLAARGWDVFVAEPSLEGGFRGWIERELPAVVEAVQAAHPGPVILVGQGYGGALALASGAVELRGKLAGAVAFNTPAEWELPGPVLGGVLARGGNFGEFAGRDGQAEFQLLFAHGARLEADVRAGFHAEGLRSLPPAFAREWLAALQSGGPALGPLTFRERIARLELPVLLTLALRDNISHAEHAACLRELAPRARVRLHALSRFEGDQEDYTHLSVLLGQFAPRDVFPEVIAWLEALR